MPKVTDHFGRPVSGQMPGFVEAIVIDNVDADKLGRVKLKFPTLPDMPESFWARLMMPHGGKHTDGFQRGWMTIPEIDDEVLVTFIRGDINFAVVVGSLYNGVDTPPYCNEDENNNLRVFQSRSGHRITFDDTPGAERVEMIMHNEEIRVIFDSTEKTLSIYCGKNLIVEAKETIKVDCLDWIVEASESLNFNAGSSFEIANGADLIVEGGSQLTIKGGTVMLN